MKKILQLRGLCPAAILKDKPLFKTELSWGPGKRETSQVPEFDSHRQDTIPVGCGRKQRACADRPNSAGIKRLVPGCEASEAWQQTHQPEITPSLRSVGRACYVEWSSLPQNKNSEAPADPFMPRESLPPVGQQWWAFKAWRQVSLQTSGLCKPEHAKLILRRASITKPCDSSPEWPHLL